MFALYLVKSGSKFPRYINRKGHDQIQGLALTVEKILKHCAAWETAELQQFSTEPVREWTNNTDQGVELRIPRCDSIMLALFSLTGLAGD